MIKLTDLRSSLILFLLALPMCLGIAHASGTPVFAGVIAGVCGGLIVSILGGSEVSVTGPAAGLTILVYLSIKILGSFEAVALAVVIAGVLQVILGLFKGGRISSFVPNSVVQGMMLSIGLIIILKQLPHALGLDSDFLGDENFDQPDGHNTFSQILLSFKSLHLGALIIFVSSFVAMMAGERLFKKKKKHFNFMSPPLMAIVVGILIQAIFQMISPELVLDDSHLLSLPDIKLRFLTPDTQLTNMELLFLPEFWKVVVMIFFVATLEGLLCLEASDKLDPKRRTSQKNRDLIAQGMANMCSGFLGGLPVTAILIRTTANITAGAETRWSAFLHAVWILFSIFFLKEYLKMIPLASLAAILVVVGGYLFNFNKFKKAWNRGFDHFVPLMVTMIAIIFTDFMWGILIGLLVGLLFILKRSYHDAIMMIQHEDGYLIRFYQHLSFLHKASLKSFFEKIPPGSKVLVDGSRQIYIDDDIVETIEDFIETGAEKNIQVTIQKSQLALSPFFREK